MGMEMVPWLLDSSKIESHYNSSITPIKLVATLLQAAFMADLSKYIQKELSSLLRKVQKNPPKKSSSLLNLQRLVSSAPIDRSQKQQISKTILTIQNTIRNSAQTTPQKTQGTLKLSSERAKSANPRSKKEGYYEKMFLEEKVQSSYQVMRKEVASEEKRSLLNKLRLLREHRKAREEHLQEVIVRVQRMERLKLVRLENEDKYLQSKTLSLEFRKKQVFKQQALQAARMNKHKEVKVLMSKFNNIS